MLLFTLYSQRGWARRVGALEGCFSRFLEILKLNKCAFFLRGGELEGDGGGGLRGEGVVFPDLRKWIRLLTDEIIPIQLHQL